MRRCWRVGCLALCVVGLLLTSCGGLADLAPKEPVTIRFAYGGGSEDDWLPLVEQFRQNNKHITIELVGTGGFGPQGMSDYDVMLGPSFMLNFMQQEDFAMDLNAMAMEDETVSLNDFYPPALAALSADNKRLGLPMAVDLLVMYYNKDFFDRKGVAYPQADWTWDQFLDTAVRLSDPGRGEFGYAYSGIGGMGFQEPMLWIYQAGGQIFDDLQNPTQLTLNTPVNVQAMQWYADLIHKHHVAPQPGERTSPFPQTGIEAGQYAMWMGWLSDSYDLNVGVVPLPRGELSVTQGQVIGVFISAATDYPEACWEWAKFLSGMVVPGLMPARQSLANADTTIASVGADVIAAGRASLPNMIVMGFGMEGQLGQTWGAASAALTGAFARIQGGDPVQEVLNEAQAKSGF